MDPREFQRLARTLVHGRDAAELRTAISRAYYAVFLVAVELLDGMGFSIPRNHQGHTEVQNYLNHSGQADIRAIGSQLGDLRAKRNRADYQLNSLDVENPNTVRLLILQATQMIDTMERHFLGNGRSQIREALQQWRRGLSS